MYLQYRDYKDEDDLGLVAKLNLLGDFKEKVREYKPNLIIWSVVEDAFKKTLRMLNAIKDYKGINLVGECYPLLTLSMF